MIRKVLAAVMLVAGFAVLIWGILIVIFASDAYDSGFEESTLFAAAAIIFGVLALGAYLLWPKSN